MHRSAPVHVAASGGIIELPTMAEVHVSRQRLLVGACGVLGPLLLVLYFGAPVLEPPLANAVYASNPPTAQVVDAGSRYHDLLFLGTWFQAVGALLSVVFFVGVTHLAGAATRLAGMLVVMSAAVLLGVVLAEGVFTLTWAGAAAAGQAGSARASFDLMASFIRVFPMVPAPAVYLSLGAALLGTGVLPRAFAPLAIGLGAAFALVGLAGVLVPAATIASAVLSGVQDVWVLAAAVALLVGTRSPSRP